MKCIVTGATGFIGTALCRELLAAGNEVYAVVRENSKKKYKLISLVEENTKVKNLLRLIPLEIDDLDKLSKDYDIKADVFFHLAWNGSSGADRDDYTIQMKNVQYMETVIRAAKACGCKRIIGAGSQAEYGVVLGVAKESETVPNPFMMYGAAKLAAYQMGQVLAKQLEIDLIWPRIYSVYGVGENSGTLVNYVIDTLLKGEEPQLSQCENMWNFLYISDCVNMLISLAQKAAVEPGIYHIASHDTRLLKDFVTSIRDIVAPKMTLGFGVKKSDPDRTFWLEPDISKIESISDSCEISFEEGIRKKLEDR